MDVGVGYCITGFFLAILVVLFYGYGGALSFLYNICIVFHLLVLDLFGFSSSVDVKKKWQLVLL